MKKFFTLFISLSAFFSICSAGSPTISTSVVISQVYGGAGCGTAGCSTYKNDFIELYNLGAAPVCLSGWSVQYSSAAGATWAVTPLGNVILQPGQYYLVAEAAGPNGVSAIPTPDATGTIAMSATAGKVALVNSTTPLVGACPVSASIVDLVGFGTTASCNEGGANAPVPSTTTADTRAGAGTVDTDNNAADFTAIAPNPRNMTGVVTSCGVVAVSLQNFTAVKSSGNANIHWFANCTSASLDFVVERSSNGTDFKPVHSLTASQARCAEPFDFTDANLLSGKNYYRLKIIDVDGKISYSRTVLILNGMTDKSLLSVRPTIVSAQANLYYASAAAENILWTVTDMQGRIIKKIALPVLNGENKLLIPVAELSKGQYLIKGFSPTGSTATVQFIKQ